MSHQLVVRTAGQVSQTIDVNLEQNAASGSAGDPLTGLAYNTGSFTCYARQGATGTATAVSLVTQTVGGAFASGGFVEVDGTHAKGLYRFDPPNTYLNAPGITTFTFQGATNLRPHTLYVLCTGLDLFGGILPRYTGTAQAGSSNTITLASGTTSTQAALGDTIVLTGGATVGGASGIIGATISLGGTGTPVATIQGTWNGTVPASGTTYEIIKSGGAVPLIADVSPTNRLRVSVQEVLDTQQIGTGVAGDNYRPTGTSPS